MLHSKTEALSFKRATCMVNSDAIATARVPDSFQLDLVQHEHITCRCLGNTFTETTPAAQYLAVSVEIYVLSVCDPLDLHTVRL